MISICYKLYQPTIYNSSLKIGVCRSLRRGKVRTHPPALLYLLHPWHPTSLATPAAIEVAQHLFQATTISEAIRGLNDAEKLILRELVACGGRANSRDLALYLSNSSTLYPVKGAEFSCIIEQGNMLYPTAHPHGVFEQSLRRLLMLGLLFWVSRPILLAATIQVGSTMAS